MAFGQSVRKSQANGGKKKKHERSHGDEDRTEQRLLAQREAIDAKLAKINAAKTPQTELQARKQAQASSPEEPVTKDYGDQRVVIKFWYEHFGSPPEDEWKQRYGTISRIRSRMEGCAPTPDTVYRTLKRLAEGDEDIASKPGSGGGESKMSADEDLLVGLLACRGFSQPMALQYLNLKRLEAVNHDPDKYDPVSLSTLKRAEARVQLLRRKRRSQKAGSVDLESDWAKASLAQSLQLKAQFEAGARGGVEPPPPSPTPAAKDGPTLDVGGMRVRTCATDPWGALGQTVTVQNSIWGRSWKGSSQMVIKGYTPDWKWRREVAPAYFLDCVKAEHRGHLYAFPPSDVYALLSDEFTAALEAAEDTAAAEEDCEVDETDEGPPPPLVIEQCFWLDEHHEQCKLGKTSLHDCLLPRDKDGNVDLINGEYGDWSDSTRVKFPQEVRFLLGAAATRKPDGELEGRRMEEPYEYTGKWVVGFKAFEKALRAEIHRVNEDLVGGGDWSDTKHYTKEELRALPGGRYQAWRIENASGDGDDEWRDNWREDVVAAVGRGSSACVCVKELIDAAIIEGDKIFVDTEYKDSWWLCHDALSQWWEKEAQDYIASRGFKDRQLRAWGSTNKGTRYHHSLVGNRPEMMPMDAHLFADLKTAVGRHVVVTAGRDKDDETRCKHGTPRELSATLRKAWTVVPEPHRIIEDVSRIPSTVDKIIEYRGGVVPDAVLRHGRRSLRGKRPMVLHPEAQAAAEELLIELDAEVKRARKV